MYPALAASIILTATAGAGGGGSDASAPLPHIYEIKAFASTLAVAKTASGLCPDILVSIDMLGKLKARLHMTESDKPAFAEEGRLAVASLSSAIAEAPSRQAWCDGVLQLYGPHGSMIPGLMRR